MSELAKTDNYITHSAFRYDVPPLCELMDAGMELKDAVRQLHPTLPPKAIPHIVRKVRKSPYYLARMELQTNILKAKGPELQQNLLDIALEGRSERNRLEATNSALDRVYGNAKEEQAEKPMLVFNFSWGDDKPQVKTEVIDVTPTD